MIFHSACRSVAFCLYASTYAFLVLIQRVIRYYKESMDMIQQSFYWLLLHARHSLDRKCYIPWVLNPELQKIGLDWADLLLFPFLRFQNFPQTEYDRREVTTAKWSGTLNMCSVVGYMEKVKVKFPLKVKHWEKLLRYQIKVSKRLNLDEMLVCWTQRKDKRKNDETNWYWPQASPFYQLSVCIKHVHTRCLYILGSCLY